MFILFQTAAIALFSAASSPPPCPAGEVWDGAMAMCMPQAVLDTASDTASHKPLSNAQRYDAMTHPGGCGSASYFHFGMSMCLVKPRAAGAYSAMLMGNLFVTASEGQGPRFKRTLAVPHWLMAQVGVDILAWQRLELDVMLTAERWLYPARGYAELLQIGERRANGTPYVDTQHPHSSPLMGLALTDVITWGAPRTRILRLWFAPRGESTDGPIAFMHRPSGTVNPDTPLGHHIGQDVGHITSTVLGASLGIDKTTLEVSAFHGREPFPTRVDLPLGKPDSGALRVIHYVNSALTAAASAAYISNPEADGSIDYRVRYSASLYRYGRWLSSFRTHAALVWGGLHEVDRAEAQRLFLHAIAIEAMVQDDVNTLWSRTEVLQRTAGQLHIPIAQAQAAHFVEVVTVGYTRQLMHVGPVDILLGGMATLHALPRTFEQTYGSRLLWTGRAFLEARFMTMFSG